MKKTAVFALLCALAVLLCACAPAQTGGTPAQQSPAQESEAASPLPTPSPSPTPTPMPAPSLEDVLANFDLPGACVPAALYEKDGDTRAYEAVLQQKEVTQSLCACYAAWTDELARAAGKACAQYGGAKLRTDIVQPSWQTLAAVAFQCETPEDFAALYPQIADVTLSGSGIAVHIDGGEDDASHAFTLRVTPKTPQVLFGELPLPEGSDPTSIPMGLFTCVYLNTLYDEDMERVPDDEESTIPLAEPLTFPLPERFEFRDSWYDDRDGGARRHTGTDILCPEGTQELACVDGVITAVGTGTGTGNYVVLTGGDGTQYHYYHMVEVSRLVSPGDRVRRGDPIGLAGNTGNSTANHLHFTIVHPSGVYLNPYPFLREAELFGGEG